MEGKTPEEVRIALLEALEALAPVHGIDIVDVEVVGSAKARTVRVRIDHADEGVAQDARVVEAGAQAIGPAEQGAESVASVEPAAQAGEPAAQPAEQGAESVASVEPVAQAAEPAEQAELVDEPAAQAAGPITLEEVSAQTGWISELIDELDPIDGAYVLEVSSPGLARPLRRARDFERFAGEQVALKTTATEGRRRFTGTLRGFEDGAVLLTSDGEDVSIPLDEVRSCKIKPAFDDGGRKGKGGKGRGKAQAGRR